MKIDPPTTAATPGAATPVDKAANAARAEEALALAREFEAAFVAEMLSKAGLAEAVSANAGFGGEAMASMMVEAWARELVEAGGFGLAPKIAARALRA